MFSLSGKSMAGFPQPNIGMTTCLNRTGNQGVKMPSSNFKPADRVPVKCFKLNGLLYVPHYAQHGYAYPGIKKHSLPIPEAYLVKAGAKEVQEFLYDSYIRGGRK